MMTENAARHLRGEEIYRVVTVINGQRKVQRWDLEKTLILPEPLNFVLKVKHGKVYWTSRGVSDHVNESEMDLLGDLQPFTEFKLQHPECSIVIERINWAAAISEARESTDVASCLYYLAIQGSGGVRGAVENFKKEYHLVQAGKKVARIKTTSDGIQLDCKSQGVIATWAGSRQETLIPGQTYTFKNAQLADLKITSRTDWWKFKPVSRSMEVLTDLPPAYEEDSKPLTIMGLIVVGFILVSFGNFVFHSWTGTTGSPENLNASGEKPPVAPVAIETAPASMKLPEKFIQERKTHVAEIENKNSKQVAMQDAAPPVESAPAQQAILGDGKLPPGGEKDGPQAPAAAKGNGMPPAENGGALGTMQGKLSDAAPLPKTNKVHVGNGLQKDALFTKQKIAPLATTDAARKSTKVIALDQDQAKKVLERKAKDLKSAFGSVLGYLNETQAPDALAVTDPNAKGDTKLPKKGGMLVAAGGTGSGQTNDDQVRVLGQVGSAAGKGIVGGTGGSPNGVAGGYGLSTRFKGTGTEEGSGIGGSKNGNPFMGFDALNSTGEFAGAISEGLTKAEVGKVIHDHAAEIRQCYENALVKTPGIKGRMIMDFAISPAGAVNKAAVKEAAFDASHLGGCLASKMKLWNFPHPRNGVTVQVTYPFNFRTLGGGSP